MSTDDDSIIFGTDESGIIDLQKPAKDVLLEIGLILVRHPEHESFGITFNDDDGMSYTFLIALEGFPGVEDVTHPTKSVH